MANKSDFYQHKLVEISLEPHKLNNFANESGISKCMADMVFDEEILELRQELLTEIYSIVKDGKLTKHQERVLMLSLTGATQNEIAKELGCSQSAIHKTLSGNVDYRNGRRRYGGVIKKLQKLSRDNGRILDILKQIELCKNSKLENEE